MVAIRTPLMRNYEQLIDAMKSERNTFSAGDVLDRARAVIENWKKQHDDIRRLLDPQGVDQDKPIATLVADKWAMIDRPAISAADRSKTEQNPDSRETRPR